VTTPRAHTSFLAGQQVVLYLPVKTSSRGARAISAKSAGTSTRKSASKGSSRGASKTVAKRASKRQPSKSSS